MSFTQKYKKDIIDLLNKNNILDKKRKKKIKLFKNNFNNTNKNSFLQIVNLKHYLLNKNLERNKLATPTHLSEHSKINSEFSIFCNKKIKSKIDKGTNTIREYTAKLIPFYRFNHQKKIKNFSSDKIKFNVTYNKKYFLKYIDDEIKNSIDINTKYYLSKNDSNFKLLNKLERLNFYKRIQKAYDKINDIKRNNFYFDKSLFLFSPLKKKVLF